MKSREQLIEEFVDDLVVLDEESMRMISGHNYPYRVNSLGNMYERFFKYKEKALEFQKQMREQMTKCFSVFLDEYLNQFPIPPLVDAIYLEKIFNGLSELSQETDGVGTITQEDAKNLLGHMQHLQQMMVSPEGEAIGKAHEQGRRDGRIEKQVEIDDLKFAINDLPEYYQRIVYARIEERKEMRKLEL